MESLNVAKIVAYSLLALAVFGTFLGVILYIVLSKKK